MGAAGYDLATVCVIRCPQGGINLEPSTLNLEPRTSNLEPNVPRMPAVRSKFNVQCSMFDVQSSMLQVICFQLCRTGKAGSWLRTLQSGHHTGQIKAAHPDNLVA